MKILLIDNYDSFTYNLYHYISFLKCNVEVFRNDKVDIKEIDKKKYKKIVISPGPGNPNQAGNCLKIVKHFYKSIPILGVCLGHQIIGQVFKSKIVGAKKLMHGKTSVIRHDGSYGGSRGLWELAVTLHGILCYDTSITNDVLGHLNTEEVNKQLQAVKEL